MKIHRAVDNRRKLPVELNQRMERRNRYPWMCQGVVKVKERNSEPVTVVFVSRESSFTNINTLAVTHTGVKVSVLFVWEDESL